MDRSVTLFLILATLAIGQNDVDARATLKIVNGTTAEEGEFPYMVQVVQVLFGPLSTVLCGGTIIGPEWILTQGYCAIETVSLIASGSTKLYRQGVQDIQVNKIKNQFLHPKWESPEESEILYDVGLIQLEKPLEFTDKIQPIKLPDTEDVPFHVPGTISGWGPDSTHHYREARHLQKMSVQLLNDQECKEKLDVLRPNSFLPAHHLCSVGESNGICYVDMGGPVVVNGIQYGIISWADKMCGGNVVGYSRLTNPEYRNWIKNVTGI